jgi:hypothetical protein
MQKEPTAFLQKGHRHAKGTNRLSPEVAASLSKSVSLDVPVPVRGMFTVFLSDAHTWRSVTILFAPSCYVVLFHIVLKHKARLW